MTYDGLEITYTAPESFEGVELEFSFGKNAMLRGYAIIPIIKGQLGDVEVDGDVDNYDLNALVSNLTGKADLNRAMSRSVGLSFLAADLNEDGVITIADITMLINLLNHPTE